MSLRFRRASDGALFDSGLCDRNLNVLAHAQAIELDIGSQCGGHGVCGGDRVRIGEEHRGRFSAITEAERRHLSAEELAQGWRLGCQCFPEEDGMDLEVEVLGH